MSNETSKGIWIAVVTGLLALLGTATTGVVEALR